MKKVWLPSQRGAWTALGPLQVELSEITLEATGYHLSSVQMWDKKEDEYPLVPLVWRVVV